MLIEFADEIDDDIDAPSSTLPPWKVLVVDDEKDMHLITTMALDGFELEGRTLSFLHAYSGEEAKNILKTEKDIALVFLDVVMETDDAGLLVAHWLREELHNSFTRIILRTGQPGHAPEEEVIVKYDINDYKEKTELNRRKLFTTTFAALRAYRDIIKVEDARSYQEMYRLGLEKVIQSTTNILEKRTLSDFFNGLLQQVVSLLKIDRKSVLVQFKSLGAIYNNNDYEIIAKTYKQQQNSIDLDVLYYLNKARAAKKTIIEDDILVGYFPSSSKKISLLYLKGISTLSDIDHKLLEVFSNNVSLAFDNLLLNREIMETQEELIFRLGDVVESRSNEAGNHIRRMAEVSYMLALDIGLPADEAELLKQAAPMHDIGKVATPDSVLLKPARLTDDEMAVMQRHPITGYDILKGSARPMLQAAAIISQQHHEKYDGSGYPQGLKADEIHIFARIVAVADVFDALTHKRCYKEAWPIDDVIKYLHQAMGTHLDPNIVHSLLKNIDQAIAINNQYQ